jgi:hypothetical protein
LVRGSIKATIMNADSNHTESWTPCAAGALQTLARRLKVRRRLHGIIRAAGVAVVLLCVTALSVWSVGLLRGEREYHFGGIACHEVRANLDAFATGALSDELTERIEIHLKQCPACQEVMKQMNEPQISTVSRQATNFSCPRCRARVWNQP